MTVNKTLIKQRKDEYGDSFVELAEVWSSYLSTEIEPSHVSHMLALLKKSRINNIKHKLATTTIGTEMYFNLVKALDDSIQDYNNYMWIASQFEEYMNL